MCVVLQRSSRKCVSETTTSPCTSQRGSARPRQPRAGAPGGEGAVRPSPLAVNCRMMTGLPASVASLGLDKRHELNE